MEVNQEIKKIEETEDGGRRGTQYETCSLQRFTWIEEHHLDGYLFAFTSLPDLIPVHSMIKTLY